MTGWHALRVADVEGIPWRGTELVWHPLRAALGLRAFGAAAYTATREGQPLVEAHRESVDGRGHEELYVVLEGSARFELDGEPVVLPRRVSARRPVARRWSSVRVPQRQRRIEVAVGGGCGPRHGRRVGGPRLGGISRHGTPGSGSASGKAAHSGISRRRTAKTRSSVGLSRRRRESRAGPGPRGASPYPAPFAVRANAPAAPR